MRAGWMALLSGSESETLFRTCGEAEGFTSAQSGGPISPDRIGMPCGTRGGAIDDGATTLSHGPGLDLL